MIYLLVFCGLFALLVSALYLFAGRASTATRQTLARLDAIATGLPGSAHKEDQGFRKEEGFSEIRWLDSLLRRIDVARTMRMWLSQAEVSWTAGKLLLSILLIGSVCGYLVYLRTESTFMAVLLTGIMGSMPALYVERKRQRRFDRMKQRLPEALDLMVSAMRAGHTFASAMNMASKEAAEPVRREFRQCFDEQNYGLDLRVAVNNLLDRMPIREMRMIAASVLIQKETGGNLTEILEKVAILIREDFRLQRQVQVHTTQGRMTGRVLSMLPVILGCGLYLVNPEQMSILWTRPIGIQMLKVAGVMTLIGMLLIRKIVRVRI